MQYKAAHVSVNGISVSIHSVVAMFLVLGMVEKYPITGMFM